MTGRRTAHLRALPRPSLPTGVRSRTATGPAHHRPADIPMGAAGPPTAGRTCAARLLRRSRRGPTTAAPTSIGWWPRCSPVPTGVSETDEPGVGPLPGARRAAPGQKPKASLNCGVLANLVGLAAFGDDADFVTLGGSRLSARRRASRHGPAPGSTVHRARPDLPDHHRRPAPDGRRLPAPGRRPDHRLGGRPPARGRRPDPSSRSSATRRSSSGPSRAAASSSGATTSR